MGLSVVPVADSTAVAADGEALVVTAGEVHTGTGKVYRPGAVSIVDGKVAAVGRPEDVAIPAGARRIDAGPDASLVPGLVAAQTEPAARAGENPESVALEVRAIDGYDFAAPETRLLAAGITTMFLSPGSNRVITGRGAVVKTAGPSREARTLRAEAAIVAGVGESVARPPAMIEPPAEPDATSAPIEPWRRQFPVTRSGSLMLLRQALGADAAGSEVRIGADTAGDLDAAIAFAKERSLAAVLVGARDAAASVDAIRTAGFPVVLRWPLPVGRVGAAWDADEHALRLAAKRNAAVLAAAGVRFALAAPEAAAPDLLFVAASAAQHGLAPERAVAAITSDAAAVLGVSDRVGALEPGRDGDLVVLSGRPAQLRTFAVTTIVGGEIVWERKQSGTAVVVRAAQVHLGDGRVLAPGEVAFEEGRIVEVGPAVGVPPGARLIDLPGGSVMPGVVDAFSRAGLSGEGGRPAGDVSTSVPAARGLSALDPSWALLASRGVTTALVAPGAGGRVGGRASVVKTHGGALASRVVAEDAGIVVRLRGERDLAAASKEVEDLLEKVKAYKESFEKFEKEKKEYDAWKKARDEEEAKRKAAEAAKPKEDAPAPEKKEEKPAEKPAEKPPASEEKKKDEKPEEKQEPRKPRVDEALAGWLPVLEAKLPLLVHASRVEEIRAALALGEKWKLRLVLVGAEDVRHVADEVAKANARVVAAALAMTEERGRPVNLLRELVQSGLPAAMGSDAWLGGAELLDVAGYAVARGLSPSSAVRLLTGDAAKLLGLDARLGTIAPGRDADLVLITGEPFGEGSSIRAVFVGGAEVTLAR